MVYNKNYQLDTVVANICRKEYPYFLNKGNVVGVALGYKITGGFSTLRKCITVFVKKKLPLNYLSKENIIPEFFKNIITDVVESGVFTCFSLNSRIRPVVNGYSIGNTLSREVGTCGCLVYDKYLYILSSNHILAVNNTAPIESVLVQPGVGDGGTIKKDVIGYLSRLIPIKYGQKPPLPENLVDCAICKVINRSFVSPIIEFIGKPKELARARLNEDVQKVGRSSELTFGQITNLYGTTVMESPEHREALFVNQIFTTSMSDNGDSGALLLTQNKYGVGLLMGGSNQRSVYNSLDDVLSALKVKLVI